MPAVYRRFVALGDSQTEGLNDTEGGRAGFRGWADRFAEHLAATTSPDLAYANLAVRGCRARHVLEHQLPAALELQPDLASVVVGMNDLLRHDYDLDETVDQVEHAFATLRATGATVVTMTFPDVARMLPVMSWLRPRQVRLNERLLAAAERHRIGVLDLFPLALAGSPAIWSHDRIHASSLGHARIASGMAELFALPGADPAWSELPELRPPTGLGAVRREAAWLASFLGPFLVRQLTGRGSDVAGPPKRPQLHPVRTAHGRPAPEGETAVEGVGSISD